jgi:hypothetical protein
VPKAKKPSSARSGATAAKSGPSYWLFKEDLRFLLVFSGVLDIYFVS